MNKKYLNPVNTIQDKDRTAPVTVRDIGSLEKALEEFAKPRDDKYQEIDVSWIDSAINQKLVENRFSPYEIISINPAPYVSAAYGNGIVITIAIDGSFAYTVNGGKSFEYGRLFDGVLMRVPSGIAYGDGCFIVVSSDGKMLKITDPLDPGSRRFLNSPIAPWSDIAFSGGVFVAVTSDGRIYRSEDKGDTWAESPSPEPVQFTAITAGAKGIFAAVSNSGTARCAMSRDYGITWTSYVMPENNQWIDITWSETHKTYAACSLDGDNRFALWDTENVKWVAVKAPQQNTWRAISAGNGVFTAVASDGTLQAASSYDGKKWYSIETPSGSWSVLVRTAKFFIAFSSSAEADGANAIRSSNGGLTSVLFADSDETKAGKETAKAVSPKTLHDMFPLDIKYGGTGAKDILSASQTLKFTRYGSWKSEWNNDANLVNESCVLRVQHSLNVPENSNFGQLFTAYDGYSDTKSQIYLSHFGTIHYRGCAGGIWTRWNTPFMKTEIIPVENGGTGNTEGTVSRALKADHAVNADNSNNANIAAALSSTLPISGGGTGATDAVQARANLGLGNVNNTSDLNKPISTAVQAALNGKQNVLTLPLPVSQGGTGRTDGHAQGLGDHQWIDAHTDNYWTIPVFDDGADPKPIKWASASGLINKILPSPLGIDKGGTGNTAGNAVSSNIINWGGNRQTSVPSETGLSYCTVWGANDPNIAVNYGVPVSGIGSSLLSLHKANIDGIGNDVTAQLFFSNDNSLWLRTNTHGQNIQKGSPWIPMLTAINGLQAPDSSKWIRINEGDRFTLPAGGSWAYFYLSVAVDGSVRTPFAGVAPGGTALAGDPTFPFTKGFAWRVA